MLVWVDWEGLNVIGFFSDGVFFYGYCQVCFGESIEENYIFWEGDLCKECSRLEGGNSFNIGESESDKKGCRCKMW